MTIGAISLMRMLSLPAFTVAPTSIGCGAIVIV
jgi:hypothetical protein